MPKKPFCEHRYWRQSNEKGAAVDNQDRRAWEEGGVERAMLLPPSQTQTVAGSGPTATSAATIFASCPAAVF